MSKSTPIQIVEKYYNRLLQYEAAAKDNLLNPEQVKEKLMGVIQDGADIEDSLWSDAVTDLVTSQADKRADIDKAAVKFSMFAEFYSLTNDKKLPLDVEKKLKELEVIENFKESHSIEGNKFVKNKDVKSAASKEQIKFVYDIISKEIK